jgi:release factor glutamine methyltransferase
MKKENNFTQLVTLLTPRYGKPEAISISKILFEDIFNTKHPLEKVLTADEEILFTSLRERLIIGEPLQYVTGMADFFGLKFKVTPDVLIPRSETEELVDRCIKHLKNSQKQDLRILDIGTGSGCIPITIKKKMPNIEVFACDISAAALAIATENAVNNRMSINWILADILDENTWRQFPKFDLIVSNPPYITEKEKSLLPDHVLNHEPSLALFVPNERPLLFYEKIAQFGKTQLTSMGILIFECNEFYSVKVKEMLAEKEYQKTKNYYDIFEKNRFAEGIN